MNVKKVFSVFMMLIFILAVILVLNFAFTPSTISASSYSVKTISNTGNPDPMLYFVIGIIIIATGALVIGFLRKEEV